MDLIKSIENEFLKEDLPSFGPGDTVKVNVKVSEGNRERIQTFEGVIIAINGVGVNKAITVRKLSFGVGVERIFPVDAHNCAHCAQDRGVGYISFLRPFR